MKENLLTLIRAACSVDTSHTVSRLDKEKEHIPLLIGKNVRHKFEDGEIYQGKVIAPVPGFPAWYNIQYENEESIYTYRLVDDYKDGNLEIVVQ